MNKYLQCFKTKFPLSLFILPCIPGVSYMPFYFVYTIGLIFIVVYLILKTIMWFNYNIILSEYISNNTNFMIYVGIAYIVLLQIALTILFKMRDNFLKFNMKKSKNKNITSLKNNSILKYLTSSIGISILVIMGIILSWFSLNIIESLPIIGSIVSSILIKFKNTLGQNFVYLLMMWWGWGLSFLVGIIPIIGQIISPFLTLLPQNLLLLFIGISIVCGEFNLDSTDYDHLPLTRQIFDGFKF